MPGTDAREQAEKAHLMLEPEADQEARDREAEERNRDPWEAALDELERDRRQDQDLAPDGPD